MNLRLSKIVRNYFYPSSWGQADEAIAKFNWILKLRWIAIIAQLFSIIPGTMTGLLSHNNIVLFGFIVLTMGAINIASMFLAKNLKIRQVHLFLQITADLVILSALLFITGGLRNPFVTILLFHAVLGSLLLKGSWNFAYFSLLALSLLGLYWAPPPQSVINGSIHISVLLASQLIVAFVIWRFTSWLNETLLAYRQHVVHLEQHQNRMDRLRALGALASGFSHEFATPLNTIKLRLDRIERKLDQSNGTSTQDDVSTAKEAIAQCEVSLKNLFRVQMDETAFALQALPLDIFIKRICESWKSEHPTAKLDFTVASKNTFLCKIPQLALSQTILNLLDNAWQAAADAHIKVEVSSLDKWIILRICDNGPGLSPLILEKMGEPFVTTKSDGTGLGLFNAINLMEALGGRFAINNLPMGGAEATLNLLQDLDTQ